MGDKKWLAEQFEANRSHLRKVAFRMLGSLNEADDAVQQAWLRASGPKNQTIENLGGWLTTIVSRVCLDMLRSRRAKREETLDESISVETNPAVPPLDLEEEMILADTVGLALMVVIARLAPAERVAFVLHDMFDITFDEIAPIVGRTSTATRQLASRARHRVRGQSGLAQSNLQSQRKIADAFIAASRSGDLETLLRLLDPSVTLRSDPAAVQLGGSSELRGASDVAKSILGRAQAARSLVMDGQVGIVVAPRGQLILALRLQFMGEKITQVEVIADRNVLSRLDLVIFDG